MHPRAFMAEPMNKACLFAWTLVMVGAVAAESAPRASPTPQPRVRLDPVTRGAMPASRERAPAQAASGAVMMSPLVVKATILAAEDPQPEPPPAGPFTLASGGSIWKQDTGGRRVEVGVFPYRNILWKDDKFHSNRNQFGTELLRVSW